MLNKIFEKQNNMESYLERARMEDKLEALRKENENLKHQQIIDNINNVKEVLEAKIENKNNAQQVQVMNNNVNVNVNFNPYGRLKYDFGIFCSLFLLNIFFPGIDTIVTGIAYGNTVTPNKTSKLICRGIWDFITYPIIFGWIWAIVDSLNYFEDGHWICG